MAIGFKHGSSGVDLLNFDVINFSSEKGTVQPTNPKENTIWVDTTNQLNCWTYSYEMPVRRSKNKNFVTYPPRDAVVDSEVTSVVTKNGLTFTLNTDMNSADAGKITVNGTSTATGNTFYRQSYDTIESGLFFLPKGDYYMSGCPAGGGKTKYRLGFARVDLSNPKNGIGSVYDDGNGVSITIPEDSLCRVGIVIASGVTIENKTFYFQIESGSSATSYVRGNANGQVWLKPSSDSYVSFEALKRNSKGNSIMFHPGECWLFRNNYGWQNYSTATYDKTKIYQNGEWVSLVSPTPDDDGGDTVYYYKPGDTCDAITGGWTNSGWSYSGQNISQHSSVEDNYIHLVSTPQSLDAIGTVNKINLSGINAINIDINVKSVGSKTEVCICTSKDIKNGTVLKRVTTTGQQNISLDVSSYNDSYYVVIYTAGFTSPEGEFDPFGGESYITSVWADSGESSSGGSSGGGSGGSSGNENGGGNSGEEDSGGGTTGGGDDSGEDTGGDSGGGSSGAVYYDAGNEYKSVTGGWTSTDWTAGTSYNILSSEDFAKLNSNHIYLLTANSPPTMVTMGTKNKVNLSGVSTLKANINTTIGGIVELWIGTDRNYLNRVAYDQIGTKGEHTLNVNVNTYNSSYYIAVCVIYPYGGNMAETKVTKIWSE